jgi:MFS family permease
MPQGLSIALAGPLAGRLVDRIGPRWIVMFGFVLMAINTFQLSQITLTTDYATLRWLLVLRGLALGCTMQPTTLTALAAVPSELRTNASSLVTAMRSVCQSFGVAMLSTVVQTQSVNHAQVLGWQVRPDSSQGMFLLQAIGSLQQQGLTQAAAHAAAVGLVLSQIGQQASVLAFGDAYRISFVAAVIAFGLSMVLPRRGVSADPGAAMGH